MNDRDLLIEEKVGFNNVSIQYLKQKRKSHKELIAYCVKKFNIYTLLKIGLKTGQTWQAKRHHNCLNHEIEYFSIHYIISD
jgi:hypothetical protein